jgi:hypothetical protein
MSLRSLNKLLAGLLFFACTPLFAAPVVIDVAGIKSDGMFRNAGNTVLTYQVGANASITNVRYSINLTAIGPSWLSEIAFTASDSAITQGILVRPGFGNDQAGTAAYTNDLTLKDFGLGFDVGADGLLRVEFHETLDDGVVTPDGKWNFGTITITYAPDTTPPANVPEPATALLLAAGLMMIGYGRRRVFF